MPNIDPHARHESSIQSNLISHLQWCHFETLWCLDHTTATPMAFSNQLANLSAIIPLFLFL
uniref:Uncharacterized protein n=1 Tax=Arundo donax TaxID=35708 RepID=A0A0A9B766_ARUDO